MQTISMLANRLESVRPFKEAEAWWMFRAAALAEAVGWTLLITGIAIRTRGGLGSGIAVPVAGRIHGIFFIVYFGVLLATYSSLHWPRWKFVLAIAAGVPPYGTLLFELWASRQRRNKQARIHFRSIILVASKD